MGKQAEEEGATVLKGRKLGHVANALGKGDGGGAPSKQGRKPTGGLKACVVVVEGEEDAGTAPQGRRDPLDSVGSEGGAGGNAPASKRKPIEYPLGDDSKRRRGAETTKPKQQLGTGQRLEPGLHVGVQGSAHEPADKPAGCFGNDDHPRETLRAPLHEQA